MRGTDGVGVAEVDVDGLRESALLLPIRHTPRWQALVFSILGVFLSGLAVIMLVLSIVQREWPGIVGFLLLGGLGAVFCVAAVAGLTSRRHTVLGLRLTPTRLIFHGGGDPLVVSWDDVCGVRLYTIRYGFRRLLPRPWHNWLAVDVRDPQAVLRSAGRSTAAKVMSGLNSPTLITVPDKRMVANPVLVYHAARHYLGAPEDRNELGTERDVERVQNLRPY